MKIHCIGVGGIGVSSLAQYYLAKGHQVSGSDLEPSEVTNFLEEKGIKVFVGNSENNITKDLDLVVFSPAVQKGNPELQQARKHGIICKSYPEALGELTENHYTIAVAGSHGKSTVTAMIGLMLEKANFDPTVIVGTKVKEFGNTNFRQGKSKYLVIEACEYDDSFLHYHPDIIVLTNIDKEHLDYFKTLSNEVKEFQKFIVRLKLDGVLVINDDDKGNKKMKTKPLEKINAKVRSYSLKQPDTKKIKVGVPGEHNVSNGLAVLAVGRELQIKDDIVLEVLSQFKGTWRRFEILQGKADEKSITIISDYAHHPTEILATLKAAREKYLYPPKFSKGKIRRASNIWLLFQPHQHQRTYYLWDNFVGLFRKPLADQVIITDIYDVAGRETQAISKKISAKKLVEAINKKNVMYLSQKKSEGYIKKNISDGDVLIIMGAGNIYKLVNHFQK